MIDLLFVCYVVRGGGLGAPRPLVLLLQRASDAPDEAGDVSTLQNTAATSRRPPPSRFSLVSSAERTQSRDFYRQPGTREVRRQALPT